MRPLRTFCTWRRVARPTGLDGTVEARVGGPQASGLDRLGPGIGTQFKDAFGIAHAQEVIPCHLLTYIAEGQHQGHFDHAVDQDIVGEPGRTSGVQFD